MTSTLPADGVFKVYGRAQLVDNANNWQRLDLFEPLNWRRQERGLGSAALDIVRPLRTSSVADLPFTTVGGGLWVVIVNSSKLSDPAAASVSGWSGEADAVEWWGFLRTAPVEQFANGDFDGVVEASEFGYYLLGQPTRHPTFHPGYNPVIDDQIYGNRPLEKAVQGAPPADSWTVRQAAEDLTAAQAIAMEIDWLALPPLLDEVETWPSYEGESLMTALDQLLGPMGWYFDITTSEGSVAIKVYTKSSYGEGEDLGPDEGQRRQLTTDAKTLKLSITEHAERYDQVILRGERPLITFTASTYGATPSLVRGWTAAAQSRFVAGPPDSTSNADLEAAAEAALGGFDPDTWETEEDYQTSLQEEIQRFTEAEYDRNRYWRERNEPEVYSRFVWNTDAFAGNRLLLSLFPGRELPTIQPPPGTVQVGEARKIIAFPRYRWQDPTTQELLEEPQVLPDSDAQPAPTAWEAGPHLTVPIVDDEDRVVGWHQPFFAVRSIGNLSTARWESGGQFIRKQEWQDLTLPGPGRQTGEMEYNGLSVTIKLPWPEALASPFRDNWVDLVSVDDTPAITWGGTYGRNDEEWFNTSAAASARNPAFIEYVDKGHWGRMIFTVSVYSAQQLELVQTLDPKLERIKIVDDPQLQFWLYLAGTVVDFLETDRLTSLREGNNPDFPTTDAKYAQAVTTTPRYLATDQEFVEAEGEDYQVTRNTVPEAFERLQLFSAWFGKSRRAVELRLPVFADALGWPTSPTHDEGWQLGQLVDKITDGGRELDVDTAVSSVEVILGADPVRIVTTEVPQAPPMSRFRQLLD